MPKRQKKRIIKAIGQQLDICRTCEKKNKKGQDGNLSVKKVQECMFGCKVGEMIFKLKDELESNKKENNDELVEHKNKFVRVSQIVCVDKLNELLRNGLNYKECAAYFEICDDTLRKFVTRERKKGVKIHYTLSRGQKFSIKKHNEMIEKGLTLKEAANYFGIHRATLIKKLRVLEDKGVFVYRARQQKGGEAC